MLSWGLGGGLNRLRGKDSENGRGFERGIGAKGMARIGTGDMDGEADRVCVKDIVQSLSGGP
jgi:hypothetical protein